MEAEKPRRDPAHLTTPNLLREAKALLIKHGWGQGPRTRRPTRDCLCAAEACQAVWKGSGPISPMKALARAINPNFKPYDGGYNQVDIVLEWNDKPDRTIGEIHAMFDRAAEIADEAEKSYVPL